MTHAGGGRTLNGAIDRIEAHFTSRHTRAALLARQALGKVQPEDRAVRERLVQEMRAETRIDGSVGGAPLPTIWRAIELMDLGHGGDQVGTIRVLGWVLNLQDKPGNYAEGCTPTRHQRGTCEHYLGGFFSPGPPNKRVTPITLPHGSAVRKERAARFMISCLALRAVLRGGQEKRAPVVRHLESLVGLQERWGEWGGFLAPDMVTAALHALALAPPPFRSILPRAAAYVVENQSADGTWEGANLFQAVAALAAAGTPEARLGIRRAVPALLSRQRRDGTFGTVARDERALIGLRALVLVRREMEEQPAHAG